MSFRGALQALRLAASAALLGACLAGVLLDISGYSGDQLERWRMLGAGLLFVPALLFSARLPVRVEEATARRPSAISAD